MSDPTPSSEVKPGPQTTEFWKSLAVTIIGLGLLTYGLIVGKNDLAFIGGGMAGVAVTGYSIGRGIAKSAAVVLLCLSIGLGGCANTQPPSTLTTYGQSLVAYNSQLDAVIALYQSGKIDPKTYHDAVLPAERAARDALRQWRAAVDAGQPVDVAHLLLTEALATLRTYVAEAQTVTPAPAH